MHVLVKSVIYTDKYTCARLPRLSSPLSVYLGSRNWWALRGQQMPSTNPPGHLRPKWTTLMPGLFSAPKLTGRSKVAGYAPHTRDANLRIVSQPVLNLRTTTSHKCAAVPRRARIKGS